MAGVLQKLTDAENVYLGMAAGVVTKSINYPLLVWKNSCQQGLPLIFNPKQIYRGLPVACMNLGSATALQFALTGFFQKLFTAGEDRKLTTNEELSAAFIGGLISGVVPVCFFCLKLFFFEKSCQKKKQLFLCLFDWESSKTTVVQKTPEIHLREQI